jgi:hypothetical protein
VWLVTSDWPPVWGWKAELISSFTPTSWKSSFQNVLVNTGSRSLTMEHNIPWRRTMLSKKAIATVETEYGWLNGMKWANFENLSTMVKTIDLLPTFGNPSTKSIMISSHTYLGTGRGWRSPAGCRCLVLFLWHNRHPEQIHELGDMLRDCKMMNETGWVSFHHPHGP